jgi:SAM-dependent methyltransferase
LSQYYERNYWPVLPANLDARILDIGCGQGNLVRFLLGLGYHNITAIDADERAITDVQGLAGVDAKKVAIGDSLPSELGGPWDLIVAKQMVYYLDRQQAPTFLRSLAKALAEDGRLVVEIFNGGLISGRFTELKDPAILTAYTDLGLKRLLEWNGLKVERLYGANAGGSVFTRTLRSIWIRFYRLLLILERGRDDELPAISEKSIIAVAKRG